MTTVDVVLRYSGQPSEAAIFALGSLRDVYGIRRVSFARAEQTLTVEFDATRLNTATVEQLVRRTGLRVEEIVPQLAPEVAAAPAA
jgi:hypothetical protein